MHIESGIVVGAKMAIGAVCAIGSFSMLGKIATESLRSSSAALLFAARSVIAMAATLVFFQILPHFTAGPSEVHFIFGAALLLMLGTAPAAVGLSAGLLLQGLLFAQTDLPQYGMNVTTLLVPLFAIHAFAQHKIAKGTAFKDLSYKQALQLSTTYQAGVVSWVAFWVFLGQGFSIEALSSLALFAGSYAVVVMIEPLVSLGLLALAKKAEHSALKALVNPRLFAN